MLRSHGGEVQRNGHHRRVPGGIGRSRPRSIVAHTAGESQLAAASNAELGCAWWPWCVLLTRGGAKGSADEGRRVPPGEPRHRGVVRSHPRQGPGCAQRLARCREFPVRTSTPAITATTWPEVMVGVGLRRLHALRASRSSSATSSVGEGSADFGPGCRRKVAIGIARRGVAPASAEGPMSIPPALRARPGSVRRAGPRTGVSHAAGAQRAAARFVRGPDRADGDRLARRTPRRSEQAHRGSRHRLWADRAGRHLCPENARRSDHHRQRPVGAPTGARHRVRGRCGGRSGGAVTLRGCRAARGAADRP